jgi:hypothetical protein
MLHSQTTIITKKYAMNRKQKSFLPAMAFVFLLGLQSGVITASAQPPGQGQRPSLPPIPIKGDTTAYSFQVLYPCLCRKKNTGC